MKKNEKLMILANFEKSCTFYIWYSCYKVTFSYKEAASKLWGNGGLTLLKKKCLRRRTVLTQSALCSPDLGECFTYPEHVPKCYRKFFRGSQSQKLPENT